jgi:hypothetical protein
MLKQKTSRDQSVLANPRKILLVYEDGPAREHAIRSTPDLVELHPIESGSRVAWRSFAELSDAARAAESATDAATADLVIFAISTKGDLPQEIKLWIETSLVKRSEREGAIVCLVARHAIPGELAGVKEIYLRHVAHRAGMDYLSQIPSASAITMPDSLDSYTERSRQITSLLADILGPTPARRLHP